MNKLIKPILFITILFSLTTFVFSDCYTPLTDQTNNITDNTTLCQGNYDFNSSGFAFQSPPGVFRINSGGITFDCNNSTLNGDYGGDMIIINADNVTIKNCDINAVSKAIDIFGSNNLVLQDINTTNTQIAINNTGSDSNFSNINISNSDTGIWDYQTNNNKYENIIINNSNEGMEFNDVTNLILTKSRITDCNQGLFLIQIIIVQNDVNKNLIYNNYFDNIIDINAGEAKNYDYNTQKQIGATPNIVEGSNMGGNYYKNYLGTDLDGDGIGDTNLPYEILSRYGGQFDYLPLTIQTYSDCNLPWGGTINHDSNTIAYDTNSVDCNESCISEIRVCNDGNLSGNYLNQNCDKFCDNCTLDGVSVDHNENKLFYSLIQSTNCTNYSILRTCYDGNLSESEDFKYSSCTNQSSGGGSSHTIIKPVIIDKNELNEITLDKNKLLNEDKNEGIVEEIIEELEEEKFDFIKNLNKLFNSLNENPIEKFDFIKYLTNLFKIFIKN